jgi:hypothetical protein
MPHTNRLRRRFAALAAAGALGGAALAAPSPAAAGEDHFCQYVTMPSGSNCYATTARTLQYVRGWTINTYDRICAASFTAPFGTQSSDWRCDYGYVEKLLGGRVYGVGALHNGDPDAFVGYGVQGY